MEKPDTAELAKCLENANGCIEKYVMSYIDYAIESDANFDPGVDISRLIVSLGIVIQRLKNKDPERLFLNLY